MGEERREVLGLDRLCKNWGEGCEPCEHLFGAHGVPECFDLSEAIGSMWDKKKIERFAGKVVEVLRDEARGGEKVILPINILLVGVGIFVELNRWAERIGKEVA